MTPLTCASDGGDWDWYYEMPEDFSTLDTKRRKRCSCGALINIGEQVLKIRRFRHPRYDIEESIYGTDSEIDLAFAYLCEKCGDIAMNLDALGYNVSPTEKMPELLKEYQELAERDREVKRAIKKRGDKECPAA